MFVRRRLLRPIGVPNERVPDLWERPPRALAMPTMVGRQGAAAPLANHRASLPRLFSSISGASQVTLDDACVGSGLFHPGPSPFGLCARATHTHQIFASLATIRGYARGYDEPFHTHIIPHVSNRPSQERVK